MKASKMETLQGLSRNQLLSVIEGLTAIANQPMNGNSTVEIHDINLMDDFNMTNIHELAELGFYKTTDAAISDLSKVCRKVMDSNEFFIVKAFDSKEERYVMKPVTMDIFMKQLRAKKLGFKSGKKTVTLADAVEAHGSRISVNGLAFNSKKPNVFNLFNGFKYKPAEEFNPEKINFFLDFLLNIIANENLKVYEYLLNWIAFIVQNPGAKTEICVVLQGAQGTGKNSFTDTLSELFAGYSASNVTDIEELTGSFNSVIEGKMLLVCNEMKNYGSSRLANHDALKSIITDTRIRINEKYMPRHDAENVANLIIATNNDFPVKIENGDRRYLVLEVSPAQKGKLQYWAKFNEGKDDEFYSQLMRFLLDRDISKFNTRDIPPTQAKTDLMHASGGKFGRWIDLHYDELTGKGIRVTKIMSLRPTEGKFAIEEATFKLAIQKKLRKTMKQFKEGEPKKWVYLLREEYREGHHQITENGTDMADVKNEDELDEASIDMN